MRAIPITLLLALATMLPGCGDDAKPAVTSSIASSATPSDPALAQMYANSCQLCHANPAANAPLTGDRKAWEPRIQLKRVIVAEIAPGVLGLDLIDRAVAAHVANEHRLLAPLKAADLVALEHRLSLLLHTLEPDHEPAKGSASPSRHSV